jgi:acyl carrier protein
MNIVIVIEEEFQVNFDDGQVEEMMNVSLILYFLKENLSKAKKD